MAFGTSRIFKSTDVGAPQFNNAAGSLNAVLKAVLCTGYGSTPSLGWTVEFESGNVLVVRMKGGTRTFIQFDDTLTGSYTYVAAYSTMSSAFTGTERMPAAGQTASYIVKTQGTTTNVPWEIIGDDRGFYLLHRGKEGAVGQNTASKKIHSLVYIGDFIPLDLRNKWNFCLLTNINGYSCGIYRHTPSVDIPHYIMRDYLFNKGPVSVGIYGTFFAGGTYSDQGQLNSIVSPNGKYSYTNGLYNGIVLQHSAIFIGTMGDDTICLLGKLPGLYGPCIAQNSTNTILADVFDSRLEFITEGKGMVCYAVMTSYPHDSRFASLGFASLLVGEGFRNV